MASRSSFLFTFLPLFAVLLVAVSVAARSANPRHGHHAQLRVHAQRLGPEIDTFQLVDVLEFQEEGSNELPRFQIAVRVRGELEYLYAEGEKVLSTRKPDSVGTARTFWQVVAAPSDRHALSSLSFALANKDTGARLYYDFENTSFFTAYVESGQVTPLTNWRLWRSEEESSLYKLQYVQDPGRGEFAEWAEGDLPYIFHIISAARPLRDTEYEEVRVQIGTAFQLLTIREDGKKLYLYGDGNRVLTTSNPKSVGEKKTFWLAADGFAPLILPYVNAFAIRNLDSQLVLQYDGELYLVNNPGLPLAGWKVFSSTSASGVFKLTYLPYANGYIPGTFDFRPLPQGLISLKPLA